MQKTCLSCGTEFQGSAQARFHSEACRKAYARRKMIDPDLPEHDVAEPALEAVPTKLVEFEGKLVPQVNFPSMTEEAYVRECRALAENFIAETSPQATQSTKTLEGHLARAERYARGRYRGFLAGEVVSL